MKIILSTVMAAAVLGCAHQAIAEDQVVWKVQDRFRLFDQASPDARQRVETLLDQLQVEGKTGPSGALRRQYENVLATLRGGQADSLRRSNWLWAKDTKTPGARRYSPGYVYPQAYRITAGLAATGVAGVCQWQVANLPALTAPCAEKVTLTAPAQRQGAGWGSSTSASVTRPDGATLRFPILIEDRLVVALGDSFISGEGNPDQPAQIAEDLPADARFDRVDWMGSKAAADHIKPAEWWDEPCHRSLLSWPVLASLLEASRDDHAAVTLVHLGCSGAEGPLGLYAPQKDLPGGGAEIRSQASQLQDLIAQQASPRKIDRLFLSLGGNDIGFASVIAYLFVPPNGYGLGPLDVVPAMAAGAVAGTVRPYDADRRPLWALGRFKRSAQRRMLALPARLAQVDKTLQDLGVTSDVVYQTGYPDIFQDDRGEPCRTILAQTDLDRLAQSNPAQAARETAYGLGKSDDVRGGFEATLYTLPWFVKWKRDWNFQVQFSPDIDGTPGKPCSDQALGGDSEVCKAHWVWSNLNRQVAASAQSKGWTFIDAHIQGASGHGWCVSPNDSLRMPVAQWDGSQWRWTPASPAAFDPYRQDLGRWFRTANDSAQAQWASPERMHQGTLHPSYNMHIAYAETVAAAAFPIR